MAHNKTFHPHESLEMKRTMHFCVHDTASDYEGFARDYGQVGEVRGLPEIGTRTVTVG